VGAWGVAIFSDDTACDVRDEYRDLIGEGKSGPEAAEELLREYAGMLDVPDEGPVIWLALAATQWKLGRLQDDVKQKALEIIETGAGLDLWREQGAALLRKRQAVLRKLKEQLQTPQPPQAKVKKRFKATTAFKPGDAFSYHLLSGEYVIFRVAGLSTDKGGTAPIVNLCDWIGIDAPGPKAIEKLPSYIGDWRWTEFIFLGQVTAREYPADRTKLLASGLSVSPACLPYHVELWRMLDSALEPLVPHLRPAASYRSFFQRIWPGR
jgi:hypothetical protein